MGVLVVGAGLGGLRAAESVRGAGYEGEITVIGHEPHHPYNRPPLSKEALANGLDLTALEFRRKATSDIKWKLGSTVRRANLGAGTVTLTDGGELPFDGLVAATGLTPRHLTAPGPSQGRHVLRTFEDAAALRLLLRPGARVLIIGAGFIGCEVAATSRNLGATVTCVAIETEPMIRPLGPILGAAMRRRHEANGVTFRLGVGIESFTGTDRATGVALSSGEQLSADVIVEAVGSACNVEWLDDNGLDLTDGVLCDSDLHVMADGKALPHVFAVGDIARFPNLRFDQTPRRVEHWSMPTDTGRHAGARLAEFLTGTEPRSEPCTPLPSFWSDQYDVRLQSFGMPGIADEVRVIEGDPEQEAIFGYYRSAGSGEPARDSAQVSANSREVLVGLAGLGMLPELMARRTQIGNALS